MAADITNIAHGVYSPLEGFMTYEDYRSVLDSMRLADDTPWTIPIVLDTNRKLDAGDDIALMFGGQPLAIMRVEETYRWDKREYAEKVFRTTSIEHPGVMKTLEKGEFLVAGKIMLIGEVPEKFERYRLWPLETRVLFEEKGWKRIVGFQTRNVPHIGHEYVQKAALTFTDGLFINPLVGWKKPGDFKDEVIVKSYEALLRSYYPSDSVVFSVLRMEMRYAGPREAIFHAIVRKNFGCTHFIVGRDHAGVGSFYGPYEAWEIFREFPDLGIIPLFIREAFFCKRCGGVVNAKICPHEEVHRIRISGTRLRQAIQSGEKPPETIMRPEFAEVMLRHENPFIS